MILMKISLSFILILIAQCVFCKKVNILFLILDDMRPALGCYGDPNSYSPNIDKLATGSLLFKSAFAQQALCAPSRNSFLTSRRPDTLHLYDFYSYWRHFAGNFTTLPQYFKENGYKAMSVGKVFHPGISSNFSDDQPYSWSYDPYHPPSLSEEEFCYTKKNPTLENNIVCPVTVSMQPGKTLPDIESKNKAIEFLSKQNMSADPFFLAVGFHKPHIPLRYPEEYKSFHPLEKVELPSVRIKPDGLPNVAWNPWLDIRKRNDIKNLNISFPFGVIEDEYAKLIKQSYYAAVSYVDDLIGQILKVLAETQLAENTIIALIGDHGWSMGENGEWSKFNNFDITTKVPFILKVPGLTNSEKYTSKSSDIQNVTEPVELVDLFPTLVDLAGLESIKNCRPHSSNKVCTEGKSLVPLIMNVLKSSSGKERKPWDVYAFSQYPRPGEYPTENPNSDAPKLNEITIMGCSVRTHSYRYTEWVGFKNLKLIWDNVRAVEIYDHNVDPYESNNLNVSDKYIHIRSELRQILRNNWVK